jgi:shikimate dehydrogenase
MFPNIYKSAVDIKNFPNLSAVFDAVYNPLLSKLVVDANERGITAVGGLYMLVSQAAYAVEKFIDAPINNSRVEEVFKKLYKDKMNIVLIGMPSCGKTSVGEILSQNLSKDFVDTDNLIVESVGVSISHIFSEKGESFFRGKESEIIFDISKENKKVIATGGGTVLNKNNVDVLKENGRVYFINRPLDMLVSTDDRPLSSNRADLEKRYNERYSLYTAYADVVIDGAGTVEEVAKRIEADFYGYTCD